jgi:NAD(P)-dependent dehydrogenase (short-subunit alcohol dehydrogenase family)
MDINGQIAVITGGASGLGAATAQAFVNAGAKVALLDINLAVAQQTADRLGGQDRILAVKCDVTDDQSAADALAEVQKKYGVGRVLVNCAGVGPPKRIVGRDGPMPLADYKKVIEINLIGTFNMMRLFAAALSKAEPLDGGERGVIISTASVAAFEGQIGQAAYSSSKGGVVALTMPAAREFAQFGIRVMTIAPGIFHTPMLAALPEDAQKSLGASVPFPPRLGRPEEYADLALFIVRNGYMNGETIRIDGALRMAPR